MDDLSQATQLQREVRNARPEDWYRSLLESVDGIVWEADAHTLEFTYVSSGMTRMLGYKPEEWLDKQQGWKNYIYDDDREDVIGYLGWQAGMIRNQTFDYRIIKANGAIAWVRSRVTVTDENGTPRWLHGITEDITENKLLTDLERLEKEVLEMAPDKATDMEAVLDLYTRGIERLFPRMRCSVLQVRDNRVYNWAAPSLPADYIEAINNQEIGPAVGSCGTAAYLKTRVIVSDIASDERWTGYRDIALSHGLRACWSMPITDTHGAVTAVFGMYYDKVKAPDESELAIVERAATILKVILENRLYYKMMLEINVLMRQGQELANFGTWQWDIKRDKVSWSDTLYKIYGLDEQTFRATFDGYLAMLHPDDSERVRQTITGAIGKRGDVTFEERIVRPDGSTRNLVSWGRVVADETGNPAKMIGACLDITAAKKSETKMKEIAWMQSHVVRAPLARLMGLAHLLNDQLCGDKEHSEVVGFILASAEELDAVIRNIATSAEVQ